jgi:hypothetical protein
MAELRMLSADETLAEIRRLYFRATKDTIQRDLERALGLLKSMNSEQERERATVYMQGLAEMSKDWFRRGKARGGHKPPRKGSRPGGKGPKSRK